MNPCSDFEDISCKWPLQHSISFCSVICTMNYHKFIVSNQIDKWAVACDFQQCDILTSVDSYKPVQPPLKLRNSKWCSVSTNSHRIFKRQAKALIRLHVCAGWSEALLVVHTKLLEISCVGSIPLEYKRLWYIAPVVLLRDLLGKMTWLW